MKNPKLFIVYVISLIVSTAVFAHTPMKINGTKLHDNGAVNSKTKADSYKELQDTVIVVFNDPNLEQVVRDALNKPTGDITDGDMATLTSLVANSKNISDLTGLEHAVNLRFLAIVQTQISDITPLQNLTSLTVLRLVSTQISDITPLQNLTSLNRLSLADNQISDITALQNLTSLNRIFLSDIQIRDITALQNLTSLNRLELVLNIISDIAPLQNLTSLTFLRLVSNHISDITALQNLTSLNRLDLGLNQISDITALQNLINLNELRLEVNRLSNDDLMHLYNLDDLTLLDIRRNPGITSGSAVQTLADNLDNLECEDIRWDGTCVVDPDTLVALHVSTVPLRRPNQWLKVKVLAASTQQPVAGAMVSLQDTDNSADGVTDEKGITFLRIENTGLSGNSLNLMVEKENFAPYQATISVGNEPGLAEIYAIAYPGSTLPAQTIESGLFRKTNTGSIEIEAFFAALDSFVLGTYFGLNEKELLLNAIPGDISQIDEKSCFGFFVENFD